VRTARKQYRCEYFRGTENGGRCKNRIEAGQRYVEGEPNDTAGGWGNARYCLDCMAADYPELASMIAEATN
jgi:hypothetical protein